jgi:hypothetical protein
MLVASVMLNPYAWNAPALLSWQDPTFVLLNFTHEYTNAAASGKKAGVANPSYATDPIPDAVLDLRQMSKLNSYVAANMLRIVTVGVGVGVGIGVGPGATGVGDG